MVLGKKNKFSTEYFLLPTHIFIIAHESHEFTRITKFIDNGDLIGRTNHTNILIELVKIRATDKVAFNKQGPKIRVNSGDSWAKNIKLVGKKFYSWAARTLMAGFPSGFTIYKYVWPAGTGMATAPGLCTLAICRPPSS